MRASGREWGQWGGRWLWWARGESMSGADGNSSLRQPGIAHGTSQRNSTAQAAACIHNNSPFSLRLGVTRRSIQSLCEEAIAPLG
jgi:hypothetical protein